MKLGIIGMPNIGKSTLFNAMTKSKADMSNYLFKSTKPNIGTVNVPDSRLKFLLDMYKSAKVTPATIEFVDIAGLVKGSSKGEGLGNQFLSHIREVDALIHVVRCFENENILHVNDSVDPARDIETINFELIFADLEVLERRLTKTSKNVKNDKTLVAEEALLKKLIIELENGNLTKALDLTDEELVLVNELNLLTSKTILYALNADESDLADDGEGNPHIQAAKTIAETENSPVFVVGAKFEEEISDFPEDEIDQFMSDIGVKESALNKLIQKSYETLGLISFLTAGPMESRAWTIKKGTKAPGAAGKIHSDLERGFIKAEIVHYEDLVKTGSFSNAKSSGLVRLEGKEYVMKDGDVVLFRFNV